MLSAKFIEDINQKISEVIQSSPAKDIEKNVRVLMTGLFSKLDLITREEFDVQAQVLLRTREKLEKLEAQVAELEKRLPAG